MGNNLITIDTNSILSKNKFEDLGVNEDLQIVYKTNGKDYAIETYFGERYTLTGETVDSISRSTNYSKEEIMNILYIVYEAFEGFKTSIETSDLSSF